MTKYTINKKTTALIPAKQIAYETLIIEQQETYLHKEPALNIIEATCKEDWSSYNTRRNITIEKTGYIQKTPIPVNIKQRIIAVPTHSPNHIDCIWIILNKHIKLNKNGNHIELITNNDTITLNASIHTIENQIRRGIYVHNLLI